MITFKADRTVGCVPVFEFSGYWFTENSVTWKTLNYFDKVLISLIWVEA